MKHSLKITIFLVILFLAAQIVGLEAVRRSIDVEQYQATGNVSYVALAGNISRPDIGPTFSVLWILVAVIIGTLLVLLLIRYRQRNIWKTWFFLSVVITLTFAFDAFIGNGYIALLIAIALAIWKVYRGGILIHNVTEIFIYGGLAVIFVPVMNIWAGIILLILISLYDMYAVWKSKHMITLAKFQSKNDVFAGLLIPYKMPKPQKMLKSEKTAKKTAKKVVEKKVRTAILGGGDIGFPLIFTGIVMTDLIIKFGMATGFLMSLIITAGATAALFLLFYFAKKDKFYPAMPFISAGCFIGYGVILIFQQFI